MELFFQEEDHEYSTILGNGSIFWPDHDQAAALVPTPLKIHSAFVAYSVEAEGTRKKLLGPPSHGRLNMNKKMIDFMRRSTWPPESSSLDKMQELNKERGYRHMMSERIRREKQKNSYSVVRALLPHGTKNDKNSIVQAACERIEELQRCKEGLQRRNLELQMAATDSQEDGGTNIRVRIVNPTSGLDSMLEVLRCLNGFGIQSTTIRSNFSSDEFSAVLEIQNQIEATKVEKVIQDKLLEAERKFLWRLNNG